MKCCICGKPVYEFNKVEIIPGKLYADTNCITDLLPMAGNSNNSKEEKEKREKKIKQIIQVLIDKH